MSLAASIVGGGLALAQRATGGLSGPNQLSSSAPRINDSGGGSVADVGFIGQSGVDVTPNELTRCNELTKCGKRLVVLCWLSLKESALLIGQVARVALAPPHHRRGGAAAHGGTVAGGAAAAAAHHAAPLLEARLLEHAGREGLLRVLAQSRHKV